MCMFSPYVPDIPFPFADLAYSRPDDNVSWAVTWGVAKERETVWPETPPRRWLPGTRVRCWLLWQPSTLVPTKRRSTTERRWKEFALTLIVSRSFTMQWLLFSLANARLPWIVAILCHRVPQESIRLPQDFTASLIESILCVQIIWCGILFIYKMWLVSATQWIIYNLIYWRSELIYLFFKCFTDL